VAGEIAIYQEHLISPATAHGALWPFDPRFWRPAHYHPQVELLLVTRGSLRERVGRTVHTAHAGQLIWHLPGVEHELLAASSRCEFVVVQVEPDLCAELGRSLERGEQATSSAAPAPFKHWIRELGWLAAGRPVVELKRADQDRIREACAVTCANEGLSPEESGQRVREALAGAWRATHDDHDDRRANSLVELACCLVLEEPSLDRSAVCRELDVSEGYLSRVFPRELGLTFVEQRARSRLARFCTHVAREGHSYLDAALLAGFGSYSQLHRVFVGLVGVTPREYFSRGGRNRTADRGSPPGGCC
jgi:AraC-like DNA-binding protein/quercetin dioxygenase-like cupin family protein